MQIIFVISCVVIYLRNSFSIRLNCQFISDVTEYLANLIFSSPMHDALLQDMVNTFVALRSLAAPSLILQFGPANNLGVLLCVGIVEVIFRPTILSLGKLIFRYLCDIVHEIVSPSQPHVAILGFAKLLMLCIVTVD